jgi:hypothetical protein
LPPPEADTARFRDVAPPAFDAEAPLGSDESEEALQPERFTVSARAPWTSGESRRRFARVLTALGLLLAIFARGCEAIGVRSAGRLEAKVQLAEARFERTWRTRLLPLEQQRRDLSASNAGDAQALRAVQQELAALESQKQQEHVELSEGAWRELAAAAKEAQLNQRMWGFWREICVWLGAGLLLAGALGLTYFAQGAERWLGIALLAVIAWTVFSPQAPWLQ